MQDVKTIGNYIKNIVQEGDNQHTLKSYFSITVVADFSPADAKSIKFIILFHT